MRFVSVVAGMGVATAQRNFRASRPIAKPALPAVGDRSWSTGPIDALIAAKLDEKNLHAQSFRRQTHPSAEDPWHVNDPHASILHLLGLDHLRTTYMRNGRAERPTVTGGVIIPKLWT